MKGPAKRAVPAFIIALAIACGPLAVLAQAGAAHLTIAQAEDVQPKGLAPLLDGGPEDEAPLKPDTKSGGENAPPPKSAEETKQNRLGAPDMMALPKPQPLARPKLLAELYDKLAAADDLGKARTLMEAIEKVWFTSESDTATVLMGRAARFVSEKDEDLELAQRIADAAVEVAPGEAEAWYLRARVVFVQRNYAQAIPNLRHALAIDPKHYKALLDLGISLEELGAKKDALEVFRKALAVNPYLEQAQEEVNLLSREIGSRNL